MARHRPGQGGVIFKRCSACYREVLSAHRGAVTAVGKGAIEEIRSNGDVVAKCECGRRVEWEREIKRG